MLVPPETPLTIYRSCLLSPLTTASLTTSLTTTRPLWCLVVWAPVVNTSTLSKGSKSSSLITKKHRFDMENPHQRCYFPPPSVFSSYVDWNPYTPWNLNIWLFISPKAALRLPLMATQRNQLKVTKTVCKVIMGVFLHPPRALHSYNPCHRKFLSSMQFELLQFHLDKMPCVYKNSLDPPVVS